MRCPTCGADNTLDARYCVSCGIPLETQPGGTDSVVYCINCATGNSPEAEFCVSCGSRMRPAPESGTPPGYGVSYGQPPPATGALVARDLSELISETFRVARRNFWLFYFIALIAQIPSLIFQLIPTPEFFGDSAASPSVIVTYVLAAIVLLAAGIVLYTVAEGATIFGVASQYLDTEVRFGECYARAARRVLSLLVAAIVLFLMIVFFALLSLIIIGIPLFFYFSVSWFFYVQAILVEGKGPLESLEHSRRLVRGSWWRVFGIGVVFVLVFGVFSFILGLVAAIPESIVGSMSPAAGAIFAVIIGSAAAPVLYIGTTLVYLDLRVRNEGYTLEMLASELGEQREGRH